MGTSSFPNLSLLCRTISINGAWRIIPKEFEHNPLGMNYGNSRFSAPKGEYKILYAALNLDTAIRETLIRDDFDHNRDRILSWSAIEDSSNVVIDSTSSMNLLDLNDGKPNSIGLSSDIRHSKDYAQSRAFALEIFMEMPEIDGFYYRSRHDDCMCFAVFERSVKSKLQATRVFSLYKNPNLRPAMRKLRMEIAEPDLYRYSASIKISTGR